MNLASVTRIALVLLAALAFTGAATVHAKEQQVGWINAQQVLDEWHV